MKITDRNSETITYLRVILVFFVMLAHSYLTAVNLAAETIVMQRGSVYEFIQTLFSLVIATISSPLFFTISGLLLYRDQKVTWSLVKSKWGARVFTLLIPFLLWNAIFLGIQIAGSYIPQLSIYFSGFIFDVKQLSFFSILDALIGITRLPVNAPLWFLRDLIILVLLSPVLHYLMKHFKYAFMLLMLLVWYGFFVDYFPIPIIVERAIFFFNFGLFLNMVDTSKLEYFLQKKVVALLLVGFYLIMACLETYVRLQNGEITVLHNTVVMIGVVTAYSVVINLLNLRILRKTIYALLPITYLLFLSHNIILQTIRKAAYLILLPETDVVHLLIYFGAPILTTVSVYLFYIFMEKVFPQILAVLTGGRIIHRKAPSYT